MPGAADVAFKHSTTVDGFNCASISEELVISTFTISLKFVKFFCLSETKSFEKKMDSRHLKEEGNVFSDTRTASPALFIRLKANRIRTAGFGVFVSPQTTSKQKKKSKVTYSCHSFPLSVGGFVDRCQLC